jgi:hypothetical protein
VKLQHTATAIIGLLALSVLALLVSGKRVLINEVKVNPGDHYVVEEHGDLGASTSATLVCRYFTGRSVLVSVFWYSSNNIMGKDQCPFIASGG